jgi:pimeloyl-[acyl-carrier protein] methyl ester esterase
MEKKHLVMLPGWGMEAAVWSPLQDALADDFSLVLVEWHGIKTTSCFKERVIQLITERSFDSFALAGWSLGSLVALDIASTYSAQVSHLILFAGTSRFTVDEATHYESGWQRKIIERMKRQLVRDKEKTLLSFYESMFSALEREQGETKRFLNTINKDYMGNDIDSLLLGLDYLMETDFREKVEQITSPLLLIHGEEDTICPSSASQYMVNRVGEKATLQLMPGIGHVPFFTKPRECSGWIKEFIGGEKHD